MKDWFGHERKPPHLSPRWRSVNGGSGDGWDRAHILSLSKDPAALMIRRYAPVRRWSDAVRPVIR